MASPKTVNAKNLEDLGAPRLANLLLEVTEGDAEMRRRLRMELMAVQSPELLEKEVAKRLSTIARSKSELSLSQQRKLLKDLENQRRLIVDQIGPRKADTALSLIWQLLDLSEAVLYRCVEDPRRLIVFFRQVHQDGADFASHASVKPEDLADRVCGYILSNSFAQFDDLLATMAEPLGQSGLQHLKHNLIALSQKEPSIPKEEDRTVIAWSSSGPIYDEYIRSLSMKSAISDALKNIADLLGDVDGYIARYTKEQHRFARIATDIAVRLVAAGRAGEALTFLDNADHRGDNYLPYYDDFAWLDTRIAALEALGRVDDAQTMRWECFKAWFSTRHLRDYIRKLPDFEDFEAEEKALDHAVQGDDWEAALWFLIEWSAYDRAAGMVVAHQHELDGNEYELLGPVADALSEKYPLAATLVLRAMIDFTLDHTRSSRYRYAANHLAECESLAKRIYDFGPFEPHDAYMQRLRAEHPRKNAFWQKLA